MMQKTLALYDALCIIRSMAYHTDILKRVEPDVVASVCGVPINTARSWRNRKRVPSEHWATFAEKGWASLEELAEAVAKQ